MAVLSVILLDSDYWISFFFLCGFRKKRNPIGKGLMAFGGILGVFFRLDDGAAFCDGDKEESAGEIIEIPSSPEPEGEGTSPRMVVGHFESMGLLLDISPLPETPPAGPSLAPEPEEREQAPSVGLNLDPSQSSRRLDGGERGGNSSKRCLRVEMEESDRRWKVARQSAEASFEGNRRAALLQALEASPFETAKAELVTGIGGNFYFRIALINSLFVSPLTGQRGALEKTIEAILQCQGKPTNSLSSFLDLKCDLEHPESRKTALSPYLKRFRRVYKE